MASSTFDQEAWLRRIGYGGPRATNLETLHGVVAAHAAAIPYETIDPLLGRPPLLDVLTLQRKMIAGGRGGYCFEQNMLFRAGLRSLGYAVTSLQARIVRNLAIDAERPALHMVLRVDLPEGPFLADVGSGNLAPTAPLAMRPMLAQATPHEMMRLLSMGDDLVLQAQIGGVWEHIYRVLQVPQLDADYVVANWFSATHPDSVVANNLIVTRPGPGGTRLTLFNKRLTLRQPTGETERRHLGNTDELRAVLAHSFGLTLSAQEILVILDAVGRKGSGSQLHPFFA